VRNWIRFMRMCDAKLLDQSEIGKEMD
jgi:hypothetical protein